MGCRRFIPLVPTPRIAFLFVLLFSISLIASPSGMALGQERTPVRGGSPSSAREPQGGFAESARVVAERLAASFPRVDGLVIGFERGQVLIDRGTAEGVFQGMELDVFREGEEFKHPLTGEILGRLDKDLGMLRVLRAHERYSEATVIKKAEKAGFQKGDRVRVSMARMIVAFPNVDVEGVSGVGARSMTKELAAALVRTARFELIDERQLRSMLLADKNLRPEELADPLILKQLSDKGKVQTLLLSRLTPTADGMSLDVQVYSTLTGNPIVLASAQVHPGVITHDKPSSGPRTAVAARPAVTAPPDTSKPAIAPPQASSRPTVASMPSEHVVLDPVLDGSMMAMAVADLEGDGKSELLLAGVDRLVAFRIDGPDLRPLAEYSLSGKGTVVTLEANDVTGDGVVEVIMTLSHKGRFNALVFQWADGKLRPILEIPDLVLRPLFSNGKTPQLFGQALVPGDRTTKPIHQYTWDGRNFQPGPALDVPEGVLLLEFMMVDLGGDGAVRLVTFKGGTTLEVHSQTGDRIGSHKVSEEAMAPKNRTWHRILIEKEIVGERPQIILQREQEAGVWTRRYWTGSTAISLTVLKWDGARFHEVREMPISDGALVDYAVADLGEGLGRRLLALVVKSGRLGLGKRSEIQGFRLQ
ncbi:hypothetical protein CLG94_02090 [Candidatus Methylomirabilis limnetica]|uniref:VCBS repeat-containing protein n=1 Tax=Candidatus Methylomirabilis limnetica TaxID=2033718 RepID=A0A2T4U0I9_9BACT|nr:VCBS repeat-containing protein [Candidatus Methylomirabilis limnetica]PTL36887.1 hypothetical protein CLG94_02090 [Candidatus Methylomirabilis limnetica]